MANNKNNGTKLGAKKLDMQTLLAPAALVILYIFFSIFGNHNIITNHF